MTDLETRTIRRVSRRLIPFLIVCYFVAYLDRVNVGFAALTMNKDLGISATAYGLGAWGKTTVRDQEEPTELEDNLEAGLEARLHSPTWAVRLGPD